ncbi:DUF4199 family protein [Flavobacteriaceae bacterium R38]|nr:DUF4199 family protein [Flavobacteriaceae bacterium R38]
MQTTIKKFGTYAAITGAVLFFSALYFLSGFSYKVQEVSGYATIVASLLFVFFGIKHFRDKENDGIVSFKQALTIGVLISVFAAIAFAVVDFIFTTLISQDFVYEYIEATNSSQSPMSTSVSFALLMFVTVFLIGFIISLISALILQRKN